MTKNVVQLPLIKPDLQISFYHRLETFRHSYLAEALRSTIRQINISILDDELAEYVDPASLKKLASFGLRAEFVFPVPYLILERPSLIGYYRLLFGLSQKEFYRIPGLSQFKRLEENNSISEKLSGLLPSLCHHLSLTATSLLEGIDDINLKTLSDLQLLTVGAQFRGGQNTKLGKDATAEVFSLIEKITHKHIVEQGPRKLVIKNAAKREVSIAFSSDPDIAIVETIPSGLRPVVSIEIKGGTDISNVHNRLGEAEKSHRKAKDRGFFEFWTILAADVNLQKAKQESPTTSRFFYLSKLRNTSSVEYHAFCEIIKSILSIKN